MCANNSGRDQKNFFFIIDVRVLVLNKYSSKAHTHTIIKMCSLLHPIKNHRKIIHSVLDKGLCKFLYKIYSKFKVKLLNLP